MCILKLATFTRSNNASAPIYELALQSRRF